MFFPVVSCFSQVGTGLWPQLPERHAGCGAPGLLSEGLGDVEDVLSLGLRGDSGTGLGAADAHGTATLPGDAAGELRETGEIG